MGGFRRSLKKGMQGHDPQFIRGRIEWRAGKHQFPYSNSDYWAKAPIEIADLLPHAFLDPVVFSASSTDKFTVIGVDEVFTYRSGQAETFEIDAIKAIRPCPAISTPSHKKHLSGLEIELERGRLVLLRCEEGSPCFAMWNILLTLVGMKRR